MRLGLAIAGAALLGLSLVGAAVNLVAGWAVRRRLAPRPRPPNATPSVTLIKPLHGAAPSLAANLASFAAQDYAGQVQRLCGVADAADPAAVIAPASGAEVVVSPVVGGANRKVANLINLAPAIRGDVVVLSDADIRVAPGYLNAVVAALEQDGVGAVTCLYTGTGLEAGAPGAGWARLAAMDIDYRFLPNAAFGIALRLAKPCFGSTIAMRRETLAAIGGFEAFAEVLADDYEIGRAVRRLGLTIAIPPITVTHVCGERTARELIAHELRWARTIRRIDPAGHLGSVVTHPLPLAAVGAALAMAGGLNVAWTVGLLVVVLAGRLTQKAIIDRATGANAGPAWLLPARDVLSFAIFLASFMGDTVVWGGRRYRVDRDGVLREP